MVSGAFGALLRELVAEFTLTDNPANTTTSLLRSMCHVDDSVILGSWLQETDHKAIEDQVSDWVTEALYQTVSAWLLGGMPFEHMIDTGTVTHTWLSAADE